MACECVYVCLHAHPYQTVTSVMTPCRLGSASVESRRSCHDTNSNCRAYYVSHTDARRRALHRIFSKSMTFNKHISSTITSLER